MKIREWKSVGKAIDKLLDLEAKQEKKSITAYEFGLLERLILGHGKERVVDAVAKWIDTQVIAEMIVQHLKDQGKKPTVKRCKEVWLQTLEHIGF